LAGTVEAITLVCCSGPMNVVAALALAATTPLAASRPAAVAAIALTTAADRLVGFNRLTDFIGSGSSR
jgi:hypothetical protein